MKDTSHGEIEYIPVIKFYVPPDRGINEDTQSIELIDGFCMRPINKNTKIKDATIFLAIGNRFRDINIAEAQSIKIDTALRLSSLDGQIGIKTKNNNPESRSVFTNIGLMHLSDQNNGIYAVNADDGINIFEVDSSVNELTFPHMDISASMLRGSDDFFKNIKQYFKENIKITEKQDTAIDMLNSAFYEQTPWAKFLLCISAIELLIPPKKKTGIKLRCKNYIELILGDDMAKNFEKLYKIRCYIAHGTFHMKQGHPQFEPAFELAKAILYKQLGLTTLQS